MTFKDYILKEALSLATGTDLELLPTPYGYNVNFTVDQESYKVSFVRIKIKPYIINAAPNNVQQNLIDANIEGDGYTVSFEGPTGWSISGIMGIKANIVYQNVIQSVKLLMQQNEVYALSFVAADDAMIPIYEKLYRQFMLPDPPVGAGFIKLTSDFYLSKKWIRDNKELLPQELLWQIVKQGRMTRSDLEQAKSSRDSQRRERAVKLRRYAPYIKKYYADRYEVFYVIGVGEIGNLKTIAKSSSGYSIKEKHERILGIPATQAQIDDFNANLPEDMKKYL